MRYRSLTIVYALGAVLVPLLRDIRCGFITFPLFGHNCKNIRNIRCKDYENALQGRWQGYYGPSKVYERTLRANFLPKCVARTLGGHLEGMGGVIMGVCEK